MTRLYFLQSNDPTYNLAVEELLACNATEPVFMLWQNEPSIIIGRHQNTAAEIDGDFVKRRGIRVVRRITGGGAVYHDLGNINYSVISLRREWGADSAAHFTAPIVNALKALGINAEFSGRNDILANGLKVSGCARSVPKDHTLFHGTLLFDTDLEILSQALKPDPDKIISKGIKSVRARVGNIKEMLPEDKASMTMSEFTRHLLSTTAVFFGGECFQQIPDGLAVEAEALANAKYRTWEWNYGSSIAYQVHKKTRFAGGSIHADFNVGENRIADLRFTGDFFGSRPVEELVAKINGLSPNSENLLKTLSALPLTEWIAGISADILAELLTVEQ
ncbi:MAG: lipoate--protein ligase [Lentisphaeria bacterium]|nr:lipoate--protein ligase [Lentisphaeria bacterium]